MHQEGYLKHQPACVARRDTVGSGDVLPFSVRTISQFGQKASGMLRRTFRRAGRIPPAVIVLALVTAGLAAAQVPEGSSGDAQLDSLLNLTISSASKYVQTTSEAPSSVTVITAEEIRLFGFRTIEDVLRTVRGFYVSNDHDYGYVGVRGFARPGDYNSRILLLVNGVATNDPVFGSASVGTEFAFNLASVERIEIVRGPASAVYGAGAIFGVVNLILRNGDNFDATRATIETGSFGLMRGEATWGTNWGNGWSLMVSGQAERDRGEDFYYSEYDAPQTNFGMARGMDGDKSESVLSQLSYRGFSMNAGVSSRAKTVPTGAWGVAFNDPREQTVDEMQFIGLRANTELSATSKLDVRLSYNGGDYHGQYPYDAVNYDASSGRVLGAEILWHADFPIGARVTAGGEYRRIQRAWYSSWIGPMVYSNRNVPSTAYSGFAEGELQVLETVRIDGGLRIDDYTGYSPTASPRIAMVCTPGGGPTLKLIYGVAFRVPNFYEAHYDDPLAGIKSNLLVQPEHMKTLEAVFEQRMTRALSASVSLYRYWMNDLIDEALDPVDSMNYFRNRGTIRTTGGEAEIVAVGTDGLRGTLSYCYDNAIDLLSNATLSNSPAHIFRCSLGGPLTPWLTASGFIMYESPRLTLNGPWTPGAWMVNARAAVTLLRGLVRLETNVTNLFDVRYLLPAGPEHRQTSLLQSGRTVTVGASVDF
jgi:outer membrane cobalamin receptor